jgi:predicted RNA-binding protein with RPS1 domain
VGQRLSGHVVEELLEARTGPKLFFECGVGQTNSKGEWRMVNGMLRLDRSKLSVAKKRSARFRKKDQVDLYVSRIHAECSRLEVCADLDDVKKYKSQGKVSVSSLKPGLEVIGKVVKLVPYGVMVDVGANRLGLLHIQKVADLYGRYIDMEKGLDKFGLERGARIKLVVSSNEKKRLFLDFTESVREEAAKERAAKESQQTQADSSGMSEEELAAWDEFASKDAESVESKKEVAAADEEEEDDDGDYEEDDEDYDDYDEERDIEDALGLGTY